LMFHDGEPFAPQQGGAGFEGLFLLQAPVERHSIFAHHSFARSRKRQR
jgi:hypothetical protein